MPTAQLLADCHVDIPEALADDEFSLQLRIVGNGDDDGGGNGDDGNGAECGSCDTSDGCSSTCPSACVSGN